jgi:hypothetical protein
MNELFAPYILIIVAIVVMAVFARKLLVKVLSTVGVFLLLFVLFPGLIRHLTAAVLAIRQFFGMA